MTEPATSPSGDPLGRNFRRVGWAGFWIQLLIGAVPLMIAGFLLLFDESAILPGGRFTLLAYLAVASLMVLLFTMLWFLRYTRLGRRMAEGAVHHSYRRLKRIVWTGLTASSLGIVFSAVVIMVEVGYLLFRFLEAPQAGLPVIQTTTGDGAATWISAIDILSLMTLVMAMGAEIIVLVMGLWLLHRVSLRASQSGVTAATA